MKSILYFIVIKKMLLSCRKFRIIRKIKLSVSLINGDSLTFYLFLSLPCCCHCRFKRYIAKQTNSKNWRNCSIVTSACFPDNLSDFFSFLFRCSKRQLTWFFLSFFKDYNKNVRDFTFLSFLNIMYTDIQIYIQNDTLVFDIIRGPIYNF